MRASESVRNNELHQEHLVMAYFWYVVKDNKPWTPFVKEHFRYMWE